MTADPIGDLGENRSHILRLHDQDHSVCCSGGLAVGHHADAVAVRQLDGAVISPFRDDDVVRLSTGPQKA